MQGLNPNPFAVWVPTAEVSSAIFVAVVVAVAVVAFAEVVRFVVVVAVADAAECG